MFPVSSFDIIEENRKKDSINMKRVIACILLCLLFFAGCAKAPVEAPPAVSKNESWDDQQLFDMLFDIKNKIELRLDMTDTELRKMQEDFEIYSRKDSKSPIYRKADLYVTISTPDGDSYTYSVPEVGVRIKGNTSRTDFYNSFERIYNIVHLKLSFQETFDEKNYYGEEAKQWDSAEREMRKNRTFATLEKLDLRWNRCDDGTYLKEYFAYETYRQNGVLAPHTNLCSFDWAGIHMGVFTINEPIDKVFLSKNLPEEALGGDLYKCGWAGSSNASFSEYSSIGIENEDEGLFFAYDLKTNKKTSSHQALKSLVGGLNSSELSKERFAELVDLDTFLPYCAVSYLLGNPDDLRNNYNNCYIYFRADTGKLVVIPYDFDRCLGITTHWNPTGDGVTGDNPFGTTTLATGEAQRSPLILYSVASGGYYVQEYAKILYDIAESDWFTYENFAGIYETAKAHYDADAHPGKAFRNAKDLNLTFDIHRTSDFSSNGNISIKEYLQAKYKTMYRYLADVDTYANADIQDLPVWYIRAEFTNWNVSSNYVMAEQDGMICFRLQRNSECRLKIYNDITDRWYGTECVISTTVPYGTDDHTNIVLQPGTYRISINPDTYEITLETE